MAGDHVRWFANKQGWPIKRFNVVTEGEVDIRYFLAADRLYGKKYGKRLITEDLALFPVAKGLQGGARRVAEIFPTFRQLVDADLGPQGQLLFKAIALLDDDPVGREAYASITDRCVNIRGGRDIFLLAREFPRPEWQAGGFNQAIANANKPWAKLWCEIEDLVKPDLIRRFLSTRGLQAKDVLVEENGEIHVELDTLSKSKLVEFCEENATLEELGKIVEILKSLRYYLGLVVPAN